MAWGTKFGTGAWQVASAETVKGAGQDPVGGTLSAMVTVSVAVEEAPQGSVTLRVTTVFPMGKATLNFAIVPRTEPLALHSYVSGSFSGSLDPEPSRLTCLSQSTV